MTPERLLGFKPDFLNPTTLHPPSREIHFVCCTRFPDTRRLFTGRGWGVRRVSTSVDLGTSDTYRMGCIVFLETSNTNTRSSTQLSDLIVPRG